MRRTTVKLLMLSNYPPEMYQIIFAFPSPPIIYDNVHTTTHMYRLNSVTLRRFKIINISTEAQEV